MRRRRTGAPRRPGRARPLAALLALALLTAACRPAAGGDDEVRLTLLGTTDVHGHLLPYDYATDATTSGGLARIATLVDSIRRVDEHVLLLDSGDLLQGTPLDEYQARVRRDSVHPVVAAMNALGYDAAAPGNHEFNYGLPYLRAVLAGAAFPFLAANVSDAVTGEPAFPPFAVLERGGVRVGVLGFTTPGAAVWDRAHLEGRLRFADIVESARRWLPALRQRGVDVVVVVAHSGLGPGSSYAPETGVPEENALGRLTREVPGIDVVFAGHTHRALAEEAAGGALLLQAGRHAEHLAVAHIVLRRVDEGWRTESRRGRLLAAAGATPAPRIVERVRDAHRRTLMWLREPIGWTPDRWEAARGRVEDTPVADLIATVQRAAAGAELASTAVFDLRAAFGPGPISRRDLLGLYVYPNALRAVRVDGATLRAYLEWSARYFRTYPDTPLVNDSVPGYNFDVVTGVSYRLDLARPPGARVNDLRRHGRPVTVADTFTLAVNSYRQSGGGGARMIADAPVVFADERAVSQLLIDWVAARDTIRIAEVFEPNWSLEPPEAVERLGRELAGALRR